MRFSLLLLPIGLTSCQLLPTQTRIPPSPSPNPTIIPPRRQAQAYIGAMNRSQQAVFCRFPGGTGRATATGGLYLARPDLPPFRKIKNPRQK
jgi:hypothetical protein